MHACRHTPAPGLLTSCLQPRARSSLITHGSTLAVPARRRAHAQVDFDASRTWTSRETFLWRHTLQQALARFKSDADADAVFARLAGQAALGGLARGLGLFLRLQVGPWLVGQADAGALPAAVADACLRRLASCEKLLLGSAAAVLAG